MSQLPTFLRALYLILTFTCTAKAHDHPFRVLFQAVNTVVALDPSIKIQVGTRTFTRDFQPVNVTVTSIDSNRSQYDYVVLYSPPTPTDYTQTMPVWYDQLVNLGSTYQATNNYLSSGTVTFTFDLINWRGDFQFVVVRGANKLNPLSDPIILAESDIITNKIVNAPGQLHMNIDVDQQSMVVQWVSASPSQSVQWGSEPGRYIGSAGSTTLRYTKDQMCGGIAKTVGWRDPGNLHQATIPASHSAMAAKRVYYRVGSNADGWSNEFSFIPPSQTTEELTFLMFNDVGMKLIGVNVDMCGASDSSNCPKKPANLPNDTYFATPGFQGNDSWSINSTKLSDTLPLEKDAALALLVGDVCYAQGYFALWDWFGYQFQDSFAQWPLAVGIGNHDRDWPGTGDAFNNGRDSGGECGVPYRYRYRPLSAAVNGYDVQSKDYYSFNYGPVHFIVLDGETPSTRSTGQYEYVSQDLANLNRQKYPWVVVGVHRMMLSYPTTSNHSIGDDMVNMARLQADWFDLFYQYQVDVVVSGHNHAYSRSCPIRPDKTCYTYSNTTSYENARGIVFVQAGNAGAALSSNFDWGYWERTGIKNYMTFARQFQNGYLRFKASKTRLHMEAVSDDDRTTFDELTLTKSLQSRARGRRPGVYSEQHGG